MPAWVPRGFGALPGTGSGIEPTTLLPDDADVLAALHLDAVVVGAVAVRGVVGSSVSPWM